MHRSSVIRMKWLIDNYAAKIDKAKIKVLDVGSYDINGSYSNLLNKEKFEYSGLDIEEGPNVDIAVKNPYDWSEVATDSFDVVISGQTFEHVEFFWITMSEMTRVLKKDGLLLLIAPNSANEHRYPVDCYRFYSDGMIALARYVGLEPIHAHTNSAPGSDNTDWYSEIQADSVLVARKPYEGETKLVDLKTYQLTPPDQETYRTGLIPYKRKFKTKLLQKLTRLFVPEYRNITH